MTKYKYARVPSRGEGIVYKSGQLEVPDNPIVPFVEGDGTGPDIWRASVRVFDAAVEKAYQGARKIAWMEVFAGEKSFKQFNDWLPQDVQANITSPAFGTFYNPEYRTYRIQLRFER